MLTPLCHQELGHRLLHLHLKTHAEQKIHIMRPNTKYLILAYFNYRFYMCICIDNSISIIDICNECIHTIIFVALKSPTSPSSSTSSFSLGNAWSPLEIQWLRSFFSVWGSMWSSLVMVSRCLRFEEISGYLNWFNNSDPPMIHNGYILYTINT